MDGCKSPLEGCELREESVSVSNVRDVTFISRMSNEFLSNITKMGRGAKLRACTQDQIIHGAFLSSEVSFCSVLYFVSCFGNCCFSPPFTEKCHNNISLSRRLFDLFYRFSFWICCANVKKEQFVLFCLLGLVRVSRFLTWVITVASYLAAVVHSWCLQLYFLTTSWMMWPFNPIKLCLIHLSLSFKSVCFNVRAACVCTLCLISMYCMMMCACL